MSAGRGDFVKTLARGYVFPGDWSMVMNNNSNPLTPAPMQGHGAYNRSSQVQAAGLSPAIPLFEQAASNVALAAFPAPIVIADYGASAGRNSLAPLKAAIGALRQRVGQDRDISVVHTDLPENDFTALFQTLNGDPDSYLRGDKAVFSAAVGCSFYQQILPSCSVSLGWSSWAVQWLSRVPAQIPDQIQIAYSGDAAAHAAYARQASEDWRTFMESRDRELRPGGKIVVLTMARHANGDFGYRGVIKAIYAALLELADGGLVSQQEARRMLIPTVGRSRTDLVEPFATHGRFGNLSIEYLDVFDGADSIWAQFERDGDAGGYGARWAAFSRASVFPTLALGLDGGRNDRRAEVFLEKLETTMAARLALKPEPMVIPLALVVLAKETLASPRFGA